MTQPVDILAIGVHPDDVELGCAGTLMKHIQLGYSVAIVDLTRGELGTRGDVATRMAEAQSAAEIMGVTLRENLGFEDGFFQNDKAHQLELIKVIRKYKPRVIITNAKYDRHPDHGKSAALTHDAAFMAGLSKIETVVGGTVQQAHRPQAVYHYLQAIHTEPDLVVDITPFFEQKMKAILAYKSQFFNPDSKEPSTFISSSEFMELVKARGLHFGVPVGARYAEAFQVNRTPGVPDLVSLL